MMGNEAAIQASYADYRRVKGRKVLQLIFEVPLEMAPQVHEAFGEPLPDGSTWVAVARIDNMYEAALKETKKVGGRLAQRAGILCQEGAFLKFIEERKGNTRGVVFADSAEFVRDYCIVNSRAELDHDEDAAKRFGNLEAEYYAWLRAA